MNRHARTKAATRTTGVAASKPRPVREALTPTQEVRHPLVPTHRGVGRISLLARAFPCRGCENREACRHAEGCWRSPLPSRLDTEGVREAARRQVVRLDGLGVGRLGRDRCSGVALGPVRGVPVAARVRLHGVELVRDPSGESVPGVVAWPTRRVVAGAGSQAPLVRPRSLRRSRTRSLVQAFARLVLT